MRSLLILLFLPALLYAQDFEFSQEWDSILVEISGYQLPVPWTGGLSVSNPALCDIDADLDFDLFVGEYSGYLQFYQNVGSDVLALFEIITCRYDSIYMEESRSSPRFIDLDDV